MPLPVLVADARLGPRGEAGLRLLGALAEYVDAGLPGRRNENRASVNDSGSEDFEPTD